MIDFIYCSAQIEGNTYSKMDTDNLIKLCITSVGKKFSDAVIILNLRNAFEKIINEENNDNYLIDYDYICDLHKILTKDLLLPFEQGLIIMKKLKILIKR